MRMAVSPVASSRLCASVAVAVAAPRSSRLVRGLGAASSGCPKLVRVVVDAPNLDLRIPAEHVSTAEHRSAAGVPVGGGRSAPLCRRSGRSPSKLSAAPASTHPAAARWSPGRRRSPRVTRRHRPAPRCPCRPRSRRSSRSTPQSSAWWRCRGCSPPPRREGWAAGCGLSERLLARLSWRAAPAGAEVRGAWWQRERGGRKLFFFRVRILTLKTKAWTQEAENDLKISAPNLWIFVHALYFICIHSTKYVLSYAIHNYHKLQC